MKSGTMHRIYLLSMVLLLSKVVAGQTFIRSELPTMLTTPWEIEYGPDHFLWLTEAGGKVLRVDPVNGNKTIVYTAPDYFGGSPLENSPFCPNYAIGAGTLGLALDPDFLNPANAFIYFVYSYNSGTVNAPVTKFRIKRLSWDALSNSVINDTNLVDMIETGYDHLGGRLLAVKQNGVSYLYLSIGDHGISDQNSPTCYSPQSLNPNNYTQDVTTQNGKIHRFAIDGSIPLDNPIAGNSMFTRGHRNPQGLMYNPVADVVYDVEHGDRTDDEINILYKGMNYGWKDVRGYHGDSSYAGEGTYVSNYLPNPLIANDSLVEPIFAWCTIPDTSSFWSNWCTVAPSGGIYYGSNAIASWTNSLLVVTLKDGLTVDREVYQFKLQMNGMLEPSTVQFPNPRKYFGSDQALNGRLRDIAVSSDGQRIYLINNGGTTSDKIIVYQYDSTTAVVDENVGKTVIKLYPNPTRDRVHIAGIEQLQGFRACKIIDILGRSKDIKIEEDAVIDLSELPKGMYFIHLFYDDQTYVLACSLM